jgi:transposase
MAWVMRPPAKIKAWLSIDKMFQWVQSAPDKPAYKCRMAIWLTHTGKLHAQKVADILDVSKQAIWLWIRQYNEHGPSGLDRHGRGGRRWGLMSPQEEKDLLAPLLRQMRAGSSLKPSAVQATVEAKLQCKVSKAYVYKLLKRNGGQTRQGPAPLKTTIADTPDTFDTLSKPWLRGE